jgi:hypothetical protein
MVDRFSINFDELSKTVAKPQNTYRLADVGHKIEKVAYDLVRFRDNQDTDQLWKIEETSDGPVIVALYGDNGQLTSESKTDWDAVPHKQAMHIFYKGEPLAVFSAVDLGIPASEFSVARRWLPKKLASDQGIQKAIFEKLPNSNRVAIAKRFPELTKVAQAQMPNIEPPTTMDVKPADVTGNATALAQEVANKCKQLGIDKQALIAALSQIA